VTESVQGLTRSAGRVGAATLTSRILGLLRDQILAAYVGAGNQMDAFLVASRIPNFVRDLFAEGILSAALVPALTRDLTERGKTAAWHLGSNVITVVLAVAGGLSATAFMLAGPLVSLIAADYAAVPGKLELTVLLTKVMLPFIVLAVLAAGLMGMLNALNHYFVPALAPATFNVAIIASTVLLMPLMPAFGLEPIVAVAMGTMIGGLAQVAVQYPPLKQEGFRYRPVFDLKDAELRRVLLLMGPGALGLAASQVNVLVGTLLATNEGTGAVSWLTYAFRLMYFPISLFGVSIATAVLPPASRHATLDDGDAVRETVSRGLSLMLVLSVPATLGLVALSRPIVQLLFERGEFMPHDTAATAAALRFYAVGLVGYSAARIAGPVFYAIGASHVPSVASLVSIGVNLILGVGLASVMGFRGLALATSLAALVHGALSMVWLGRRLNGINSVPLGWLFVKTFVAAGVMAVVAATVEPWLVAIMPGRSGSMQAVRLTLTIGAAVLALVGIGWLLRIREMEDLILLVRDRVRKLLA
jgi:putative peptidoglycan lipid II flippase